MRIGARTLKTGLAITLSLAICNYLGIQPAIFSAITAMINLKPSVYQSFKDALTQIKMTITGIVIGIILGLIFGYNALVVGFASIIIILIGVRLGWETAINIGVVSTIFILDAPTANFLEHAFIRIQLIFIGLIVALTINVLLAPPDYSKTIKINLKNFHKEITSFFNKEIQNFVLGRPIDSGRIALLNNLFNESGKLRLSINQMQQETLDKSEKHMLKCNKFYELHQLNLHMLNTISLLHDIIPEKLKRRAEKGNQPYSLEYAEIMSTISEANNLIHSNADSLAEAILEDTEIKELHSIDDLGTYIDEKIETWYQKNHSDSYHLRALMEISIVIYELRSTFNEQKTLYNLIIQKP